LQVLLQDAREQVRRSARRERHDDGDRPLRPGLLRVGRGREYSGDGGGENSTHANFPVGRYERNEARWQPDQWADASHRLQMGIAPLIKLVVGVAHRLGLAAPEHDLEIDRLKAAVLIAVDDASGA